MTASGDTKGEETESRGEEGDESRGVRRRKDWRKLGMCVSEMEGGGGGGRY